MNAQVATATAAALALTFGWAGTAKALHPDRWRLDLLGYYLPKQLRWLAFATVPWCELAVPVTAATRPRASAALAGALLIGLSAAVVRARLRQSTNLIGCGCFGTSKLQDYRRVLARNAVLAAGAALVLLGRPGAEALLGSDDRLGLALALVLVLAACVWLARQADAYRQRSLEP